MDVMRISYLILLLLAPLSPLLAQEKADAAKVEADKPDAAKIDQLLKAQLTELQKLREEVDLQADKIDKLTQQVATLTDALKPKAAAAPAPTVARAEPVSTPTPPPSASTNTSA